jgi:hypothetical protein
MNGHGAQSIRSRRIDSANHVCRKVVRQIEQQNETKQ